MDLHRARFVPYPASAINALAFSHTTGESLRTDVQNSDLRLALGRANGDIEIWNPSRGEWFQEAIFRGGRDRSVEGLAWTQEPDDFDKKGKPIPGKLRLFSIGYSSTVTEWDLSTGLPKRQSSGTFAEVWCLAAQPHFRKQDGDAEKISERVGEWRGQNLVAGCADGTLAILSTADDDLHFHKFLTIPAAKKARCLSVAFQNRGVVVAGFADSTIRIFDVRNSTLLRTVTIGAGSAGAPREILIWAVKCLPNGDIVSGDSTGEVRFFDGKNFSQYQRIAGHEADVLDVAVSKDGRTLWSVGMDRRTVDYTNSASNPSGRQWARVSHKIHHEHDVKAMATFENKKLSMIASGGLDTNLVILPMRGYGTEYHRTISGLPQVQPLLSQPSKRLLLSWWAREINVWRISRQHQDATPYKLVAKILLKSEESISSASITTLSTTRHILAVSTAAEIKLFDLLEQSSGTLVVRKIDHDFPQRAARTVRFSPDGKWLAIVTHGNEIYLARICAGDANRTDLISTTMHLRRLKYRVNATQPRFGALGAYRHTINRLQFSADSRILAASDLDGHIQGWVLLGDEDPTAPRVDIPDAASSEPEDSELSDSGLQDVKRPPVMIYGQFWSQIPGAKHLPKLDSAPAILSFRPSASCSRQATSAEGSNAQPNGSPVVHPTRSNPWPIPQFVSQERYNLVVLTARHQLYEFDLLDGKLSDWSKRNPTSSLPEQFRQIRDRAVDCLWQVNSLWERWWIWGVNWVWMFDLGHDLGSAGPSSAQNTIGANGSGFLPNRKRKRDGSGAGGQMKRRDMQGLGLEAPRLLGSAATGQPHDQIAIGVNGMVDDSDDEEAALEPMTGETTGDGDEEVSNDNHAGTDHQKSWFSFKYRPILGIVPVEDDQREVKREDGTNRVTVNGDKAADASDKENGREKDAIEIVLVERPVWDLDLPPRFEVRYKQ